MRESAGNRTSPWGYFFEAIPLLLLVFLFVTLFVLGSFVDSSSYSLKTINRAGDQPSILIAFFMIVLTWTWSNIALLACLSALIGELGRVALANSRLPLNPKGAFTRGFFIFLAVLGGQLILVGKISTEATQDFHIRQDYYIRVAGFVSLLGFLVGYRPQFFLEMLRRMQLLFSKEKNLE
jgi:hypothetical protein